MKPSANGGSASDGSPPVPLLRRALDHGLGACCVALLACMAGLTVVDVVARYWLNAPVAGAYELTQLLLAALIFAALPLTTAAGEHVEIDVVFGLVNRFCQTAMLVLGAVISAVVLWVIAWRLALHGQRLLEDGAVTNALSLPLGPIGWFGAAASLLSGVMALYRLRLLRPASKLS